MKNSLIFNAEFNLYRRGDEIFCNSLQVAETFDKRHADVLRDIDNSIKDMSDSFRERNFTFSKYSTPNNKRKYPKYDLTKDGFIIITFGYGGKEAMHFKEEYIKRFNAMERFIKELNDARLGYRPMTDAILEAHDEPKRYHFSNEADMINRIVTGMSAKQYCEANNIKTDSIRPYLSEYELKAVNILERFNTSLIELGMNFQERKEKLTERFIKYRTKFTNQRLAG